jgi:hypothetical protein
LGKGLALAVEGVVRRDRVRPSSAGPLKAKLSSGEPAGLGVSLLISKRLANQLGIPRVVGTAHSTLAKAGTRTMVADFTRKAKHALHGRHSLSLNVRAKATDDAHNAKTVSKSVTL